MIRFFLALMVLLPSMAFGNVFGGYKLTDSQQRLLSMAYVIGKQYDLAETTQAILFQETLAGAFGDGIGDKSNGHLKESYGVMQIKLATARWVMWKKPHLMHEFFDSYPNDYELRDRLINDNSFNIRIGAANLYILRQYTNNWVELVVAYNTGLGGMRTLPEPRSHHYYSLVVSKLLNVIRPYNKHWLGQLF